MKFYSKFPANDLSTWLAEASVISDWNNSTKHNMFNSFFSRDHRFPLFSKNP